MSSNNPFSDVLGDMFGPHPASPTVPRKRPEKGIPWEAKLIDGDYYVPLAQVAELLATNDTLPAVRRGIEARVRAQAERKEMGL